MNDENTQSELSRLRLPSYALEDTPRARWRRRAIWIAVALVLIAGLAWFIASRHAAVQSRSRILNSGPMPVGSAAVQTGDIDVVLNGLGTVTPLRTVTVVTQIAGQLMSVGFQEGQIVRKGDFLAQIDPRPYQIALEQAQGQLQKDEALLKDAEIDLARYTKLVAEDSIAEQQLDTQKYLVEQYKGAVTIDHAQVDTANLNLVYCHITAPVAGRVGLRLVDPGNYVQPSTSTGLVVITQLQPISVIFTVPEDSVPPILQRTHGGASLPITLYDRSQTVKLATGSLAAVDNQVDVTTGQIKLRGEFANEDFNLFPNQFVNARLLVNTLHGATVIPSAAIQRGAPGTYVYLIKPDNTVAVQPVKLGQTDGDRVQVLSGLAPGGQVVTDGSDKLRDGAPVIRAQAKAAAPGAAAPGAANAQSQPKGKRAQQQAGSPQ